MPLPTLPVPVKNAHLTQSGRYSTFVYMVKMESISGSEITFFGQKMMGKSGYEFVFEIPPRGTLLSLLFKNTS